MTTPVLGHNVTGTLRADEIDTWPLAANVFDVSIHGHELQAVCPVTGNPDIYTIDIAHAGGRECESKALKMYLMSFRDRAISCADLAAEIADDLSRLLGEHVDVRLTQQVRGGLSLSAHAHGPKE